VTALNKLKEKERGREIGRVKDFLILPLTLNGQLIQDQSINDHKTMVNKSRRLERSADCGFGL